MNNLNRFDYQEDVKIDTLQQQSLNTIKDADRTNLNKDLMDSLQQKSKKNLIINMNDSQQNILSSNNSNIIQFIDFTNNYPDQEVLISKIQQNNINFNNTQILQIQNDINSYNEQLFIEEYLKNYSAILNLGNIQDINLENEKMKKLENMNIELQQKIKDENNNFNLKHLKMLNKFNLNQRELNYKMKMQNKLKKEIRNIDSQFQTHNDIQNDYTKQNQESTLPNLFDDIKTEVVRPISQKIGRINKNNLMNTFSQNIENQNQNQQHTILNDQIFKNGDSSQNKDFSSIFNRNKILENDEIISKTIHSNQSHYNNYDMNFRIKNIQKMDLNTRNSYQNAQSLMQKTNKLKNIRKKFQNEQMFIIQNEESKKHNEDDPTTNDFSSDLNIMTPITNNILVNKHFVVNYSKANKNRGQNFKEQKVSPNSQMSQNQNTSALPANLFNMSNLNLRKGITTADTSKRNKINVIQKQKLIFLKSQQELQEPFLKSMSQGNDSVISKKAMRLNLKQPQIVNIITDKNILQNINQSEYSLQQNIDIKKMQMKKEQINKKFQNMKIRNIELDAKKGMSIFHQNTFTNLFEMEARNPWFQDVHSSQVSPYTSQLNQVRNQVVSDQEFLKKGLKIKDNIIQVGDKFLLDGAQIQKSASQDQINIINDVKQYETEQTINQNLQLNSALNENLILKMDYKPSSLAIQNQKSQASTQFFKREISDSIYKSRALYQYENKQLQQIYEHITKKKNLNIQIRKNQNLQQTFDDNYQQEKNDKKQDDCFLDDDQIQQKIQNFNKIENVQTRLIEIDDFFQNRQFQKGDINQLNIQKKYDILKQQQKQIFSQRQIQPNNLFQQSQTFAYKFKNFYSKNNKQKNLNQSENTRQEKQINYDIEKLLRKQKQSKKYRKQKSFSDQSQNDRNKKSKNNEYYNCDKYLIKLNIENQQDFQDQELNQMPMLDLNVNTDIHDVIKKIDQHILTKEKMPQDLSQLSSFTIKKMAIELFQIIHDIDEVPISDKRYNRYIINVFKLFSQDPLKNANVNCSIKTCTGNLKDSSPYEKIDKNQLQTCTHTYDDDHDIKKRYLLQYWFLNFCKFLYITLLNSQVQQQISDTLFYEDNRNLVDKKFAQISKIKEKSNETVHKMIQKQSRKKQAVESILKNLQQSMSEMTKEERSILKDACTVLNLMNNPLIKLIVIKKPKMFVDYKVDTEMEKNINKIFEVEQKKVVHINELAQAIIHNYRHEILVIKKKKYITFKNYQKGLQEFKMLFDQEDEQTIIRNLEMQMQEQKVSNNQRKEIRTEEVTYRSNNNTVQLVEDDSHTNQKSSEQFFMKEQNSVQQKSYILHISPSSERLHSSKQNKEIHEPPYLNQMDALKHVLNILNEKKNVEIVAKYEQQFAKYPEKFKQNDIYNEQRKKLKKQISLFDSSYNISNETRDLFHQELLKKIPIEMQINLYKQLKMDEFKEDVKLYDKQDIQFQFYNSAKELVQGIEDKTSNIHIEYFKTLRSQHILEIPLLFKFMENNLICMKGFKLNLEQAVAIKHTLIDQQNYYKNQKQNAKIEDNPFIIKCLIIDDCSMTDEIFEQLLLGLQAQNSIKRIHYTNNNILGEKSAAILIEILKRNQPKNKLEELNLSNIIIKEVVKKDQPGVLAQILMQVDDTKLLSRLRISNINLRKEKLVLKYITSIVETFGYELQYLNLQNCNIHINDLMKISSFFQVCEKLEFLDLSWNTFPNQFTQDQLQSMNIFVDNLCSFILIQNTSLKYLDISGISFQTQNIQQIVQTLQQNSMLMSVNFGNLQSIEDRKLIKQELQIKDVEQGFLMKNKDSYNQLISEKIKFKDFYINAGLLKRMQKDKQIAESSLFQKSQMKQCDLESQLLIQRYSFNQELVMNPSTELGQFDIDQNQKWFIHQECYYLNRHRYALIYFNQKDVQQNNFQILHQQQEFINYIEKLLASDQNKSPVIVINGYIYTMIDAAVFSCFLLMKAILFEIKQIQTQKYNIFSENNKSLEPNKSNHKKLNGEKQKQNFQENLIVALKDLNEETIKQILIQMNQNILTNQDIEKMNEDQQSIASLFEIFNWERTIEENLIEKNKKLISVINPQQIKVQRLIQQTIDEQKQASSNLEAVRKTQNSEIIPPIQLSKQKSEKIQHYVPNVYTFAGYLPPGKNTIYVYDRQRRNVYFKEIIVDMMSSEFGRNGGDWMLNPTFPYFPKQIIKLVGQ